MNAFFRRLVPALALVDAFCVLFLTRGRMDAAELATRNFAVELTATVASNPPEIRLNWTGDQFALGHKIHRKAPSEISWTEIGSVGGSDTSFLDRNVAIGIPYEYKVVKEGSLDFTGYGYIYAGIQVPLTEARGRIILITEASAAEILAPELKRFEYDLLGDGWTVARASVNVSDSPLAVKERIRSLYEADRANTVALLLFGKVPIPYSGNITPDEHENHRGAWPADVFYADLDGRWTDESVHSTGAERTRNHNIPGDGKFDQSEVPSEVELQVGRVDLSNLTCFLNKTPSRTEMDLLRQYLDKNHRFRQAQVKVDQRALVFDRFGVREPEALAAMAWRTFPPFVGSEVQQLRDSEYFPVTSTKTFLWSAVCAGGGFTHSDWVGTSDNFAVNEVNVVFTMFVGSYFGDWDNESNFLRAALGASGTLLTSAYSGKPQWLYHPMALGQTIGNSARITQENALHNTYLPIHPGNGQVHISLHGDPTLRAHPLDPIRNIRGETNGNSLVLTWDASPAKNLLGYHVYKVGSPSTPILRLTQDLLAESGATIPEFNPGEYFMVRAVAITETPSGTYQNASQGVFFPDPFADHGAIPPTAPINLAITKVSPSAISLRWISSAGNETGFIVERRGQNETAFREIARVNGDSETYIDSNLPAQGTYHYRVAAWNASGLSPFGNETSVNTQSAHVEFLYLDTMTKGDWIGLYGSDGYLLAGVEDKLPPNVSIINSNTFLYTPQRTDDPRGLRIPDEELRSQNCWHGGYPFGFTINFRDDAAHQVSFYTAAWARQNTRTRVQMFDTVTGRVLDDRMLGNINDGGYAVYNIRRQVHMRVTPPGIYTNSEIYGFFIDSIQVNPPRIDPPGGTFAGKKQIQMASTTPGATIHYTLDGSEPTEASAVFADPLILLASAQVRARAYKDGAPSQIISEARFTNSIPNNLGFLRWDGLTSGSWVGQYGTDGYMVPGGRSIPAYAGASIGGGTEWTWNETTDDSRALFTDSSGQNRRASTWFTGETMALNLNIFDSRVHEVAMYFVDFDGIGREQLVEVIDSNGRVVESFALKHFQSGRYLIMSLQGNAKVQITRKDGGNAILNGIFFNSAPAELGPPPPPQVLLFTEAVGGDFLFAIEGKPQTSFCIDESLDLIDWLCVSTNSMSTTTFDFKQRLGTDQKQFFRTHYVP